MRFIDLKGGPSGPASYALIFNPYKIIEWHHQQRTPGLREDKYNALMERASEVGDDSLAPPPAPAGEAAAAAAATTMAVAGTATPEAKPEGQPAAASVTTLLSAQ